MQTTCFLTHINSSDGLQNPTGQVETLGNGIVWEQQLQGRAGDVPSQGLDAVSGRRGWLPKMYLPQSSSVCQVQGCSNDPSGQGCCHPQISFCFQIPSHQGKNQFQEELNWRQEGNQEGKAGGG